MIVLLNPQKKTQQLQGELKIIYEYKLKKKGYSVINYATHLIGMPFRTLGLCVQKDKDHVGLMKCLQKL